MFTDTGFLKCSWAHAAISFPHWCFFFNAVLPETSKVPFLSLSLFFLQRFSDSFDTINCRWWSPQIPCNRMLRNVLELLTHTIVHKVSFTHLLLSGLLLFFNHGSHLFPINVFAGGMLQNIGGNGFGHHCTVFSFYLRFTNRPTSLEIGLCIMA